MALIPLWFVLDLSAVQYKSSDIVTGQLRSAAFRQNMRSEIEANRKDTCVVAVVDPGYTGYSVYRQPLLEDIRVGEIPYGVREECHHSTLSIDYMAVRSQSEAKTRGADFIVSDDASVNKVE